MNHDATEQPLIYSIGHSDHSIQAFLELLRRHQITVVVDVRSQPYSQWAPQFNRESLARALEEAGVHYIFMGDSLGGRPTDRSFYDPGQNHPNYERLASSPAYQKAFRNCWIGPQQIRWRSCAARATITIAIGQSSSLLAWWSEEHVCSISAPMEQWMKQLINSASSDCEEMFCAHTIYHRL